jgi:hypothetical protein
MNPDRVCVQIYRWAPGSTPGYRSSQDARRSREGEMTTASEDPVYTSADAVKYLGLDRVGLSKPGESLQWQCRKGRLKFTKLGRRLIFRKSWLDELIERNATHRPE